MPDTPASTTNAGAWSGAEPAGAPDLEAEHEAQRRVGDDEQRQDGECQPERCPAIASALVLGVLVAGGPPTVEPLESRRSRRQPCGVATRREVQVDEAREQVPRDHQAERPEER